ncbi:MAG: hypothetical protein CM1200mP13_08580 [Candidatus Pelagibacterales bacterium]|nr:MAG: hypothetical protein CM1200mP13_08580 [Pelagibacterales bacterium]
MVQIHTHMQKAFFGSGFLGETKKLSMIKKQLRPSAIIKKIIIEK